jgi:hypothetical protein
VSSITLKNVPEDLMQALRRAADEDRRSVTQQIIHLLESALGGPAPRGGRAPDVEAQLAAWRKLAGQWESDVDRATETRQLLSRRTRGRAVDF